MILYSILSTIMFCRVIPRPERYEVGGNPSLYPSLSSNFNITGKTWRNYYYETKKLCRPEGGTLYRWGNGWAASVYLTGAWCQDSVIIRESRLAVVITINPTDVHDLAVDAAHTRHYASASSTAHRITSPQRTLTGTAHPLTLLTHSIAGNILCTTYKSNKYCFTP